MKTQRLVTEIPNCDICLHVDTTNTPAYADARLLLPRPAAWANVCRKHFDKHGCQLGLGKGQAFVLSDPDAKVGA